MSTIESLLKPDGRAVLVQPQRGGTANLFMQRVAAAAAAEATISQAPSQNAAERRLGARLLDRYDEKIWEMHKEHLRLNGGGGSSSSGGSPSLPSSPAAAAAAAAPPAYLPDEHQPLLVEMMMMMKTAAAGGASTGADSREARPVGPSPGSEPSTGGRSWIAWPGALPPSTAVEGVSTAVSERANGGQNPDTGDGDVGGCGGADGGVDDGAVDGAVALISAHGLDPEPPLSRSQGPVTDVAEEQLEERRPDRGMIDVYEALAERLVILVRESRRAAAAAVKSEAGQAAGAGAAGNVGVEAKAGAGDSAAVGRQPRQQLWVAVAGAPGSGKTTLAVRIGIRKNYGRVFCSRCWCCACDAGIRRWDGAIEKWCATLQILSRCSTLLKVLSKMSNVACACC